MSFFINIGFQPVDDKTNDLFPLGPLCSGATGVGLVSNRLKKFFIVMMYGCY
jgi:hypothetical protein